MSCSIFVLWQKHQHHQLYPLISYIFAHLTPQTLEGFLNTLTQHLWQAQEKPWASWHLRRKKKKRAEERIKDGLRNNHSETKGESTPPNLPTPWNCSSILMPILWGLSFLLSTSGVTSELWRHEEQLHPLCKAHTSHIARRRNRKSNPPVKTSHKFLGSGGDGLEFSVMKESPWRLKASIMLPVGDFLRQR